MKNDRQKIVILLLIAALIFSVFTIYVYSNSEPRASAKAAVLYEPETDSILYSKNHNQKLPMASTTKIMTAILAIEMLDPEEKIKVNDSAAGIEGSSVYLTGGEMIVADDLIYATLLQSANDASAAIAYAISGTIEDFAFLMNQKAIELGLQNTSFKNPHGLDSEGHYTTAIDLARLAAYALGNRHFREIAETYKKTITTQRGEVLLVNHNRLLKQYDGCIGVKTGYTKKSGRCLVSAAERGGLNLIAVTLNASNDWNDHKTMLDYGYSLLCKHTLANAGEISYTLPVIDGSSDSLKVSNEKCLHYIFNKSSTDYKTEICLPKYLVAPIQKGQTVGYVRFLKDGKIIGESAITAEISVEKINKKRFFG